MSRGRQVLPLTLCLEHSKPAIYVVQWGLWTKRDSLQAKGIVEGLAEAVDQMINGMRASHEFRMSVLVRNGLVSIHTTLDAAVGWHACVPYGGSIL